VNIPIPDLLLRLREKGKREGSEAAAAGTPAMGGWAVMASQPFAWKAALAGGRIMNVLPTKYVPVAALQAWQSSRTLPTWRGGAFRSWLHAHQKERAGSGSGAARN
jgi:L-lactate dehydrogenase complex protein LldF